MLAVWLIVKRIGGWFIGPIGKYAAMAIGALAAVKLVQKSGEDKANAEHEITGLKAQVLAHELEGEAEDEAELKSDADLIAANSRGV